MKENVLLDKSYAFALLIIRLFKHLKEEKKEYILSKQLLRSGTAVGALIREAEHAQSGLDFLNKMNISLKEANETVYWIDLLKDSNFINREQYESIHPKAVELLKMLASTVKTLKIKYKK